MMPGFSRNRIAEACFHQVARGKRILGLATFVLCLWRPAGAQTPFVNETADAANQVGAHCSLALDFSGNPHVTYQDNMAGDLKYARKRGGVWTIETADGSANNVGSYTSLALDASGNPHVIYKDNTTDNLKYARKSGGLWTIETADGSANDVGDNASLALDASGNPHVSYFDLTANILKYARKSGGVWTIETADVSPEVGDYSSLALGATGNPHISYYDDTGENLKYARKSGGVWLTETADGSANVVGRYSSLALDAAGNPHVGYQDQTTSDLKYARKVNGIWIIESVDVSVNNLGYYASLALDALGNPHIGYWDLTTNSLKHAHKSLGVWSTEIADVSASVGQYASLALDAHGNPHVSYLDQTNFDLKVATSAVRVVGPAGGATWAVGSLQRVTWTGIGPIDVMLAVDGGDGDELLESQVNGNSIAVRVPHLPTRFARIVVERASPPYSRAASDSFFTIDATIALAKFDAQTTADRQGVALTWATRPGPEADIRYRIERASGPGDLAPFVPAHTGLLDRGEFVDRDSDGRSSGRYRLVTVNGLGEEYVLGETSIAPVLSETRDLAVSPNPSPSGRVSVRFRVESSRLPTDVSVFDASGRRVRTLASGALTPGVGEELWDGRDTDNHAVPAGVYFVRLTWGNAAQATERVVVVR